MLVLNLCVDSLAMTPSPQIVGLVLAAGRSERFGGNKLQHRLANGEAMVVASARKLASVVDRTVVVIRPEETALQALLSPFSLDIVVAAEAAKGMGHSLAAGVAASRGAAGWVVALADMPYIDAKTLAQVVTTLRQGASLAAVYCRGKQGHPVGFAAQWGEALCRLTGDVGARSILLTHSASVQRIETDDPGCLIDIDRREDINAPPD